MTVWPDRCYLCVIRKVRRRSHVAILGWLRPTATTGPVPIGLCNEHATEVEHGRIAGFHTLHSQYNVDDRGWCPDCAELYAEYRRKSAAVQPPGSECGLVADGAGMASDSAGGSNG